MSSNILLIYAGELHSLHREWAQSVGAEIKEVRMGVKGFMNPKNLELMRYDIVICEDSYSMRLASFYSLFSDIKLVRIIAGIGYYNMSKSREGLKGELFASKRIDGGIAVSNMMKKYSEGFISGPVEVVEPFVEQNRFESLMSANNVSDYQKGLFISRKYELNDIKGLDILLDAVEGTSYRVNILGENTGEDIEQKEVNIEGLVMDDDEFSKFLKEAGFLIVPSRIDAFSLPVIEAMAAGTIPIVSENVGAKSLVEDIDDKLIFDPNSKSLIETLDYFKNISDEKKQNYSEECRKIAKDYSEKEQKHEFKQKLRELEQYFYG